MIKLCSVHGKHLPSPLSPLFFKEYALPTFREPHDPFTLLGGVLASFDPQLRSYTACVAMGSVSVLCSWPLIEERGSFVSTLTLVSFGPSVKVLSLSQALRPASGPKNYYGNCPSWLSFCPVTEVELLSSSVWPLPGAKHPIPSCPLHTLPCQSLSI